MERIYNKIPNIIKEKGETPVIFLEKVIEAE
mgnify:CR=1 FL=1